MVNHPATRGWHGCSSGLRAYCNALLVEWQRRGGHTKYVPFDLSAESEAVVYPTWFGNQRVHYAMMAQLIAKDPWHYNADNLRGQISDQLLQQLIQLPAEYRQFGYIWPCKFTHEQLVTWPLANLAEPAKVYRHCDGHYRNGQPCRNQAVIETRCRLHQNKPTVSAVNAVNGVNTASGVCSAICRTGQRCRNRAKYEQLCGVHRGRT